MIYFLSFLGAFVLSLLLLLLLIRILNRFRITEQPRADRWHRFPTPKFGGGGIFAGGVIAFLIAYFLNSGESEPFPFTLLMGSVLIFFFGLIDDLRPLNPTGKLIAQIIAASVAVFFGYTTNFFSPRLADTFVAQVLNSGVSIFWLVAITNAMNLLDNMDGLAGGISLIVCLVMGYFFWDSGDYSMMLFCSALSGAIFGFLVLNFPPAKIFMGDSGSQFLGYTLALLAIARQPQASNVFAIVGVPALLFTLPLADTLFVTVTRWLRGESPLKGGRDHTSHRLIAFGLSERQALWVLYSIALVGGITAILVESLNYTLSLILLPIIIIFLLIFTTYLAGVRIADVNYIQQEKRVQKIFIKVFQGRNLLEVLIDGFLISFSFYLAVSFGLSLPQAEQIEFFVQTLPLALMSGYLAFFFMQVYRDLWRHLRVKNIYRYVQAALWAAFLLWVLKFFFIANQELTVTAILIFGATLFFGLIVTRFSFQALDAISTHSRAERAERVLLYASEESLEFIVPYLTNMHNEEFHLVGLVTDQEVQIGKRVFDLQILGTIDQIVGLVRKHGIQGIVVEESKANLPVVKEQLSSLVNKERCWVKVLTLDLIDYNPFLSNEKPWRENDIAKE
ncbi:MAG: hypothetical protein N3D16_07655 [Anaerolineales bacterium]|nr:hypothetical protein [Anaerolineales bacterium]